MTALSEAIKKGTEYFADRTNQLSDNELWTYVRSEEYYNDLRSFAHAVEVETKEKLIEETKVHFVGHGLVFTGQQILTILKLTQMRGGL